MTDHNKKNSDLKIREEKKGNNSAEFVFEYLSHPSAVNSGNSLRQNLLNYVPSWGIFAIHLQNQESIATSEFDKNFTKIKETIPYLILNLKKLVLQAENDKIDEKETQILQIKIDNSEDEEYQITGQDIQGNLKAINPEVYLTTLSSHSKLEIKLYCRHYWGYRSSEEQKSALPLKEKVIFLDTDYSPVKNVAIRIDQIVISLDEQKEKLFLNITTDGSISPRNALIKSLDNWKELADTLFSSFIKGDKEKRTTE